MKNRKECFDCVQGGKYLHCGFDAAACHSRWMPIKIAPVQDAVEPIIYLVLDLDLPTAAAEVVEARFLQWGSRKGCSR